MLIRFVVSNFLSFNDEVEFNMLAATALKSHKEHVYTINNKLNVLKASAIYGANGAGKSNLVNAISSFKEIVEYGCIPKNVESKKNKVVEGAKNKPITHEIEFSLDDAVYTYGIVFDSDLCIEEWLYKTGTDKPKPVFERRFSKEKGHPVITMNADFLKVGKNKLLISLMEENLLKNNELLISKRENLKIKEIDDVCKWFKERLVVIYPEMKSTSTINGIYSDINFRGFSEEILQGLDLGIDKLELKSEDFELFFKRENINTKRSIEDIKKDVDEGYVIVLDGDDKTISVTKEKGKYVAKRVITNHNIKGKEISFEIKEESDGTQRILDFIPMINNILKERMTYVVDEIDRSLHPSLLHALIEKIMESESTHGQLVFTTHESSLLNCKIFRTDEIWFAEKDRENQNTHLYTLYEFKPRYDLDIEKGYLNGRFGAIPFLSRLEDLNWND